VDNRAQNSQELITFLEQYEKYVREVLLPTQQEIDCILAKWQQPDYWAKYKEIQSIPIPTPIKSSFSRIKRPEQVVDKILRKPDNFPDGLQPQSFQKM